jgi:excisionase family DNA binding protein
MEVTMPATQTEKKFKSVPELASEWGVSKGLVRNLIREGAIAPTRIGGRVMVSCDEVQRYVNQRTTRLDN